MLAFLRISTNSIRASGLDIASSRVCAGLGSVSSHEEDKSSTSKPHLFKADRWITSRARSCTCSVPAPNQFSFRCRCLSLKAGAVSGGQNDEVEDGFSELETPDDSEAVEDDVVDVDTTSDSTSDSDSESELSSNDTNLDETLGTELLEDSEEDEVKTISKKKFAMTPLLKLILEERGPSLSGALDKYAEGKELSRSEVYNVFMNLRRRTLFGKALQLSEWLEGREDFELSERDYASRVDLIAKVRGLEKAESCIDEIPKSFREEVVYRTLLANYVSATLVHKAEKLFNKMKDLGFPITIFTCNQFLLLYKRSDKRKIRDVLLMMEKADLKPSLFTYQVLIDIKGQSNDIQGMEQVVDQMKSEGIELNTRCQALLARHYTGAGLKEKAEEVLKEMEGNGLKNTRSMCHVLLPIYAGLGKSEEVERIWKINASSPRKTDYFAAIGAFGKLKNVKQAEIIFNQMMKTYKKLSTKQYIIMLKVYAENKMLSKGKDLLKCMGDAGCAIGPPAWDALVKLYVDIGEVEKADSVLLKASQRNPQRKPLFRSFMNILQQYSRRGDIHNAEKIFQRMRQAGYTAHLKPFHSLLQTYINAKVPAYGIRERLKADNMYPNKGLAAQIALVGSFAKNSVSELLD